MRVHALNVMVFVLVCRTTCVRVVYWNIQEDAIVYDFGAWLQRVTPFCAAVQRI